MSKFTRRLTIILVVLLMAALFLAKPFASELGKDFSHAMVDTLLNGPDEDK